MTELEDFEADMIRLQMVWFRMMTVYKEFPKLKEKGIHGDLVRNVFREYTVINLVNFIKIRRDLIKNKDFKKFDELIKPLVGPILEHEDAIVLMRNQYLVHVQEGGRNFKLRMSDIILENKFPTNYGFFRVLAGLAYFYTAHVERNFTKVWDTALAKYKEKSGETTMLSSGYKMNDTDKILGAIMKPIALKLFDNGFDTAFTKVQIEKIRKSLEP